MKRLLTATTVVVASALLLAGCGGGGGGSTEQSPMEMSDADAERVAINTAIGKAETAVKAVNDSAADTTVTAAETAISDAKAVVMAAANVPEDERTAHTARITTLESQLSTALESRKAAMNTEDQEKRKAMAAAGKAVFAALAGTSADNNALANIAAPTLSTAGLMINANSGAGTFTDDPDNTGVTLKASASAGSRSGWAGANYALTSGSDASKVTNEALVYINQGPAKSEPFSEVHNVHTEASAGEDLKGYYTVDETADLGMIMGAAFEHSGTQSHEYDSDAVVAFTTRGTFDGALGQYRCTGTCSSTNNGSGAPSALAGVWHFKPDTGATVSQPDANYLYYGWWVSKDADGEQTAASAFANTVGTIGDLATDPDTLTGPAKYAGNAAGKFAMRNTLDSTDDGGHFTADAALTAKFGSNDAPNNGGITGMIDNFRLNDGSEDPGWSVELKRAGWDSGADTFGGTGNEAMTVWSINDIKSADSGGWNGQMYDEMPGNAPDGDGSDIPTTVTGTFYSEFSTIGRMVGAFGADFVADKE